MVGDDNTFIILLGHLLDGEHSWPDPVVVPEDSSLAKYCRFRPEVRRASARVVAVDGRLVVLAVPEDQVDTVPGLGGHQLTRQFRLTTCTDKELVILIVIYT